MEKLDFYLLENTKVAELYKNAKADQEDTMEGLHQANRVRHELEVRLHAELEANYRLKRTVEDKVRVIEEYETKVDYFD